MNDSLTKSISFQLKEIQHPIFIYFTQFDLNVLHEICRILDIEGFRNPLTIKVDRELYWEIGLLFCQNHWLFNFRVEKDTDEFNVILNGFNLIFKRESE